MYGLADCNNFFVSCERVFRPELNGRPVVVLSNNDGCVVSRSNEAKALGIRMGQPLFQIRDFVRAHGVEVFSSNFALYGDMSRRVQQTLRQSVPAAEVYSIDESFLDFRGIDGAQLDRLGHEISRKVLKATGIPISVGISTTKTLAKIASKLCKRYPKLQGSCYMHRPQDIDKVLHNFPVEDVWGIGRQFAPKLRSIGILTARQFTRLPAGSVRRMMRLGGLKTWQELRGIPCIEFGEQNRDRQQITVSRSFSKEIAQVGELQQQIALFTTMAAEKLRSQHSICRSVCVFLMTNRHKPDKPQQFANRLVSLASGTDSTIELAGITARVTRELVSKPYEYKKAGVILSDILPKADRQTSLFDPVDREKQDRLMAAVDAINRKSGRQTVVVATAGFGGIRMNRQHLSPCYTTEWEDIIRIVCRGPAENG